MLGGRLRELLDPAARDRALVEVGESLKEVGRTLRQRAPRARVLFVDYLTLLPPPGQDAAPLSGVDAALGRRVAATLERLTSEAAAATGCELVRAAEASRDASRVVGGPVDNQADEIRPADARPSRPRCTPTPRACAPWPTWSSALTGWRADSMGTMIELAGLTKVFGRTRAVDDLTCSIEPGVVTGFLGPNGAGKTTTMRMILGLDHPTSGTATIDGKPYRELSDPLRHVGALLDAKQTHPNRSVRAHLRWIAATHRLPVSRVDEVLDMVGLTTVAAKKAGTLSLGMSQRLGIAAACSATRRCCCSTSRSTAWIRRASAGCGR